MIAPTDDPEALLLLQVACTPRDALWAPDAVRAARASNWDRLIGLALRENAITVLAARAERLPPRLVPPEASARMRGLSLIWTLKLRQLEKRLAESLHALDVAGIEVALLKGAALAHTTYPTFTDRPMADLDLLVAPEQAGRAFELMLACGWKVEELQFSLDAWEAHHHLPPLSDCSGSGLRLEIHQAPLAPGHPFLLDSRELLAGARIISVRGVRVRVPEPHRHVVHASVHFAWSHRCESGGLTVFRDIATLRASGVLQWDALLDAARSARAETSVYWTLRVAQALTGLDVPAPVFAALAPRLNRRMLSLLVRHFMQLTLRSRHGCPSVALRQRLWSAALELKRDERGDVVHWHAHALTGMATRDLAPPWQRLGAHLRRVPRWSRYVASLLGTAIELRA